MKYQQLIKRAWVITQEHRYLRSFGTMTSVFFLLIGALRVRYILPTPFGTMRDVYHLLEAWTPNPRPWIIGYGISIGLLYLFFMFTHFLAEGGLIASIAKIELRHIRLSFGKVLALGFHYFLPIVEYRTVTSLFDVTRYVVIILLIRFYTRAYGFYEDTIFAQATGFIIFLGVFIAILSFFLTYAEYHLVIRRAGIVKSIRKSITLVTFHFSETLLMVLITMLIVFRALINLVLVFLIPVAIFYLVSFIAAGLSLTVAIAIGGTIGVILFWLAARIAGVLLVFTTAVWTLMYLNLEQRKEYEILEEEKEADERDEDTLEDDKAEE